MAEILTRLRSLAPRDVAHIVASLVVFFICLFWAYAFKVKPSINMVIAPDDWFVHTSTADCDGETCPREGDYLKQIGELTFEEFRENRWVPLFRDVEREAGVEVRVIFEREGQRFIAYVRSGGTGFRVVHGAAFFFPLLFWSLGTVALVFLRPRNTQWLLLVLVLYDTALWGAAGFNSGEQNAFGGIGFRIFIWFFLPLLLHLHLIMPSRLWKRQEWVLWPCYALALALTVIDLSGHYLDRMVILAWVLCAVLLAISVLLGRLLVPDSAANRIVHRIVLFGFSLGVAPIVLLTLVHSYVPGPDMDYYSALTGLLFLFILPMWPGSYLYALYKHHPGKSEFRANRLLSSYGFFTLFVTAYVTCFMVGNYFPKTEDQRFAFNLGLSLLFVTVATPLRRRFQRQVDKRIYGVQYQPEEVVSLFAQRIPSAFNRPILKKVLLDDVLPTLLIRRSALYLMDEDSAAVDIVYEQDVDREYSYRQLLELRRTRPFNVNLDLSDDDPFAWVHLVVLLATQERAIGLWLLGRRDPDDYYPRSDIELLVNLANQIAPVTENVRLMEMARQEVAENQRLQEQLVQSQKMEAIGRLSAGVAHDFNNLLSVILGYSSLLISRYGKDPSLVKYLGDIRDAGKRAASLTKQLLAFSRQQVMEARIVDLNDVLADVEKMLRRLTGEDVELVTLLGESLPPVKIDPSQMGQVIMNLAVNARDAMPGGGTLTLSTRHLTLEEPLDNGQQGEIPAGDWAVMDVRDDGTGVSPELLPRIFEPYFTTKELGKGTGLGLSMVYGIINQSQGHVVVESEVGRGTSFRIFLPASEEKVGESVEAPRVVESREGDETILVVEDEDSVRSVACEILRSHGYHVLEASGGPEALRDAEAFSARIDLLLTDVVMPQMKGTELARHLLSLRPEMRVLFMSGYNDEALLGQRFGESRHNLIQKPFSPQGLASKVREMLDGAAVRETMFGQSF